MNMEVWVLWLILAAILMIGEVFSAGFFLFWFSIGAAAAGLTALMGANEIVQLVVFVVASGVLFVTGKKFANRVTKKQPPGIGADRFVGGIGIVLEEINPQANTGKVRIGQESWRADSENGEIVPAGAAVKVTRVDGTRAIVQTTQKEIK
ncbi:MAG: NfeD family protein [Acidobacteriota bacterium]|jgi:membrane protein implicated in regulation of membrane protease activity|nr:NfeD family protein [Acidobacteriota bacterium]